MADAGPGLIRRLNAERAAYLLALARRHGQTQAGEARVTAMDRLRLRTGTGCTQYISLYLVRYPVQKKDWQAWKNYSAKQPERKVHEANLCVNQGT